MTTRELDAYFRSFLDIDDFASADSSLNGLQVDNDGGEIRKVAFAVDASLEAFRRSIDAGADALFVHHGLFWGGALRIDPLLRRRLHVLFESNLALYAAHLPLDQHPVFGNNAVLSRKLGLTQITPFGLYHGRKIGCKGIFERPLSINEAAAALGVADSPSLKILPFGKPQNASCAVISGGAAMEVMQAIEEGIDLYITGECAHSVYHHVLEARINMLAGGHYATETGGLRSVMSKLSADLNLEVIFIDLPTGM